MTSDEDKMQLIPIVHACYFKASSSGENFVPHHIFSYQLSGSMIVNDGKQVYKFEPGDFRLSKRNQLAKYLKQPPPGGEFKTVAIFFDQQTLREFSATYGYEAKKTYDGPGFIKLAGSQLYKDFVESLLPYLDADQFTDRDLLALKLKEALLIILKVNPELSDVLFDFSEPGKIDLEGFMQQNFHFKVGMHRFAYLTGRSLASFKRDFKKIFKISPSRWLIQRRLQEAYFQIKEKGKRPSEIYSDLGFEDFSHFTYAFRKAYGAAPTKI